MTSQEIEETLVDKFSEGKSWKISGIWKKELIEYGSVGYLKKIKLSSSLVNFLASMRLPDLVSFKKLYSFSDRLFIGKFWSGSSGDDIYFKTFAGLWKL